MKLRNKKTGEIVEVVAVSDIAKNLDYQKELAGCFADDPAPQKPIPIFSSISLAELNEEWEDYEEPNKYWFISPIDEGIAIAEEMAGDEVDAFNKEIGNYFGTEEEAERAVEKLKAYKRLKDKGFRFERWLLGGEYGNTITFSDYIESNDETRADLDLLFGGEE